MAYNPTIYVNDTTPALSAENLNKSEQGIYSAHAAIDGYKKTKINTPLDGSLHPTFGTNGQLLRSKGDGDTEWADYGLPTDEQTEEAINSWLNEHPEATTTVQDLSLTYGKLAINTLNFVTPEMFGAVGDGTTDDTEAFNECFRYSNIRFTKGKTYKVDYISIDNDSTFVDGLGATILFNSNRSGQTIGSTSNIYKTECLSNRNDRTTQHNTFDIRNVNFDGGGETFVNYSDYSATYTALLVIQLFKYKKVNIEHCSFYDTIQDAIYLSSCENVNISNCEFIKIAYNTQLSGTRNAISVYAPTDSKTSSLNISNNSFSYVFDECMRIDDFATANISNNAAFHCYQYFAELFFNNVSGYSCDYVISGNNINDIADSFINVGSAIATVLKLTVKNNYVAKIGSSNITDNTHSTIYSCNFIQCAYNCQNKVLVEGNYVVVENVTNKASAVMALTYSDCKICNNEIIIDSNYSNSNGYFLTVKNLIMDGNKISSATGKNPFYLGFLGSINDYLKMTNNIIKLSHTRTILYADGASGDILVAKNTIEGIGSSGNLIYTKSSHTVPNFTVIGNVLKTGRYLSFEGTITNLIFVDNVLPTNFVLPNSTTYTNKIDDNNLKTIPIQ